MFAVWLAVASLGTAAAQPAAQLSPSATSAKLSTDWRRVAIDDFEVVGNAPEKELRRTLAEIENFRATLSAVVPGLVTTSHKKTILIALRDPATFQRFIPRDSRGRRRRNVGGYFMVQPYANVMVLPMFAQRETTYQVAFHEYVHYLVHRNLRNVPPWLNEGLAEFYSTFFVDSNGRGVIGRVPTGRLNALRARPMLSLGRFLDPESAIELLQTDSGIQLFYAQAWALVHYMTLSDSGQRQGQLLRYLEALQTMPSQADAAREAFGSDLNRVSDDLERYTMKYSLPAFLVPLRTGARANDARVEQLLEADALYLQGRLLTDLGAPNDAESVLTKALAMDPAHVGARMSLGRVRVEQDRKEEGIDLLTGAAEHASGEFAVHYYLATALRNLDRYEESIKSYDRALAVNNQSPETWFGLSLSAMALKRQSQSDAAMRNVQARDSNPSWHYSRSMHALGLGHNEVAARDAHEYLKGAGWGDASAPYAAFVGAIAHWRLKQESDAQALLTQAARAALPKSWTATVVSYLQGQLTDDAFLARADDDGQRTEAHAYIGIRALLVGRNEDARKHFLWVRDRGDRNYMEHGMAVAELKRLDSR